MNLRILFEDNDIIVCYKPAGIPTQTAKVGAVDMESLLKNHIYKTQKEKKTPYVAVVHRLDQPVEGLLVFAKTPFAAKELSKEVQTGAGFGKYYKAVLCGVPKEKFGRLEDYLVKDGKTNTSRVCEASEKDAKKAILNYELLQIRDEAMTEKNESGKAASKTARSLVKIKLDTGRHHQIRVQMAHMGCPIWGDTKYNSGENVGKEGVSVDNFRKQVALCAYRLEFKHPKTKKKMEFEIEPEGEVFHIFEGVNL